MLWGARSGQFLLSLHRRILVSAAMIHVFLIATLGLIRHIGQWLRCIIFHRMFTTIFLSTTSFIVWILKGPFSPFIIRSIFQWMVNEVVSVGYNSYNNLLCIWDYFCHMMASIAVAISFTFSFPLWSRNKNGKKKCSNNLLFFGVAYAKENTAASMLTRFHGLLWIQSWGVANWINILICSGLGSCPAQSSVIKKCWSLFINYLYHESIILLFFKI